MDKPMHQKWHLKVLTPLHIGCGETLLKQFDWVTYQNKETVVLDQARIWDDVLARDSKMDLALLRQPPATYINQTDLAPGSPYVKYRMPRIPQGADQREIQAVIKDVFGRPYIPGSSLKGMLRTILLWKLVQDDPSALDTHRLGGSAKTAAQFLESEYLGKDPNHDVLRVLRVGDSTPAPESALVLRTAYAFGSASPIPINVEALKRDTEMTCLVSYDPFTAHHPDLKLNERAIKLLCDLPALAQAWVEKRLEEEIRLAQHLHWLKTAGELEKLERYNSRLQGENSFLVQLGWGTGWLGKTIGPALSAAQRDDIVERFRLSRGRRRQGETFPRSRRLLGSSEGQQTALEPSIPLGWLRIRMETQ